MRENQAWEKYYITPLENSDLSMEQTLYAAYIKANSNHTNEIAIIINYLALESMK